jgi:hypothetical protein
MSAGAVFRATKTKRQESAPRKNAKKTTKKTTKETTKETIKTWP